MAPRVLNETQRHVLLWVSDGCPADVFGGFSYRITARALASKGLVKIKGRGTTWQAMLTEAGEKYLDSGPDNAAPTATPPKAGPSTRPARPAKSLGRRRTGDEHQVPTKATRKVPARLGPVDQMMTDLRNNGDRGLVVGDDEATRYRQLAASAKRHGRIPDGMQVIVNPVPGERRTRVALVPLPAWRTAVLAPVMVPARLNNPSDVVQALESSETFSVAGKARGRALRLIEAIVTSGRERGMRVKVATGVQPTDSRGYSSSGPRRDEVRFNIDADTFAVWITQGTVKVPHTPTARELERAAQGNAFPDRDTIPDPCLSIRLDGDGGEFWASSWSDTDKHRLENDLAQILEEMRLRHGRLVEQRKEQARRNEQRRVEVGQGAATCLRGLHGGSPGVCDHRSGSPVARRRTICGPMPEQLTTAAKHWTTRKNGRSAGHSRSGSTPTASIRSPRRSARRRCPLRQLRTWVRS